MKQAKKVLAAMSLAAVMIFGIVPTVNANAAELKPVTLENLDDGSYLVNVTLEGGTGRATISSPTTVNVKEGQAYADIQWSSESYDYMIVDGEEYLPVNEEGNSLFQIPIDVMNAPIDVIADTTAMSTPHEIEYTLTFDATSVKQTGGLTSADKKNSITAIVMVALILIVYQRRQKGLKKKQEEAEAKAREEAGQTPAPVAQPDTRSRMQRANDFFKNQENQDDQDAE